MKKIILILMMVILSSFAYAFEPLGAWHNFSCIDSIGSDDCGKFNGGDQSFDFPIYNFTGDGGAEALVQSVGVTTRVTFPQAWGNMNGGNDTFDFSNWVKLGSITASQSRMYFAGNEDWFLFIELLNSSHMTARISCRNDVGVATETTGIFRNDSSTFQNWIFGYDGTDCRFYVNTVLIASATTGSVRIQSNDLNMFAPVSTLGTLATSDEPRAFNYSLSTQQRNNLYNCNLVTECIAPPEVINITAPVNNTYTENSSIDIFFDIIGFEPNICELFANDTGIFEVKDTISVNGTFNVTEEIVNGTTSVFEEGLIAYWDFEEGNGSILIDRVNGRNGTIDGATYSPSKGSNGTGLTALQFDGNDLVIIPDDTTPNIVNVSVLLWAFVNETGTNIHLFSKFNTTTATGFVIFRHTSNKLRVQTGDGITWAKTNFDSTTSLITGNWYHIGLTVNSSNATIYINGVQENQVPSSVIASNDQALHLGGDNSIGTWKGKIDEIGFYDRSLTATEVLEKFNVGINATLINITVNQTTTFNKTINTSIIQNLTWNFIPNTIKRDTEYFLVCNEVLNVTSDSQFLTYKTDLTSPVINVITPDFGEALNISPIHINWTTNEVTTCAFNNTDFTLSTSNTTFYSFVETLIDNGDFVVNIMCSDLALNNATLDFNFTKDTVLPLIEWTFPNDLDTSQTIINQTATLIVQGTDLNLFAHECLIFDVNSQLAFNFTQENLPVTIFSLQENFVPFNLGNWTVQCTFSDSHTAKEFKQPKINKNLDDDKLTFTVLKEDRKSSKIRKVRKNISIQYIGKYKVDDITTEQLFDRTKFKFKYDLNGYNADTITHIYKLECDNIYYIPEETSGYKAHFVCYDSVTWVDFENPDIISYEVVECGEDCWEIETISNTNEDVEFNSIGGLNFNQEIHTFEVVASLDQEDILPILVGTSCPDDSLPQVFMYVFLFLIIIVMYMVLKVWVRVPILTITLGAIPLIIYGLSLFGCSVYIAGFFVTLALILIVIEAFFGEQR